MNNANRDFEDLLQLLEAHEARYLIIGGLAVIYHAKPRYTKDMDLLIDPVPQNVDCVNRALAEFGSPYLLTPEDPDQILQLGVAPNRVDILARIDNVRFEEAWDRRIRDRYGDQMTNWIGLDDLIRAKERLEGPRHAEDVRVLRKVKTLRQD